MTDIEGITPGSLPARCLDHMRVAGGEFEAGELDIPEPNNGFFSVPLNFRASDKAFI